MARIAQTWNMDIVVVASDPSERNRQLRVAGHNILARDAREAAERARQARQRSEGGR